MTAKNYHLIHCYYRGATMSGGSKVIIHSARFHKTRSLHYDYSIGDILKQAEEYLKEKGFTVLGHGEAAKGYYIISSTFKEL